MLRAYTTRNFVLPTNPVSAVLAQMLPAKGCPKSCKACAKKHRCSLGSLGDDASTFFDASGGLDAVSSGDGGFVDPISGVSLYSDPNTIPTLPAPGNVVFGPPGPGQPGSAYPSTQNWLNTLFSTGARIGTQAISASLAPGQRPPVVGVTPASQPGTIAGIPTQYFLYGGIGLVLLLALRSRR